MKRTNKFKKADAILTADIEYRLFAPICRTDDYWTAFQRKIKWLNDLQQKHDCPVFDAGDLVDKKYKTNPSHFLTGYIIRNNPRPFYTVPGNHDLPGKSMDNYSNSAMAVCEGAGVLKMIRPNQQVALLEQNIMLTGFGWDVPITQDDLEFESRYTNVALVHAMVYKNDLPFPGCEGYSAQEVMDLLPDVDLIVTGHHHQTFTHQDGDRLLVNPGSLMRNDADQIDHRPCVFLWYADDNTIKPVYAPIEQGVVSRDHIEEKKARSARWDAFIEKLGIRTNHGINFTKNLETAVAGQSQGVKDKVWIYAEG